MHSIFPIFVMSYSNAILGERTRRITLADRKLCGLAVLALVDRAEKLLAANVAAFAVLLLSPTATAFARAELSRVPLRHDVCAVAAFGVAAFVHAIKVILGKGPVALVHA